MEARSRAGGRVHTVPLPGEDSTSAGCLGELGGSVITGADGNPLAVLARQLGAKMHVIRDRCAASLLCVQEQPLTLRVWQLPDLRCRWHARARGYGPQGVPCVTLCQARCADLDSIRHRLSTSSTPCWMHAQRFAPTLARLQTWCHLDGRWSRFLLVRSQVSCRVELTHGSSHSCRPWRGH